MDKKSINKQISNILIPVIAEQALVTLSNMIITGYIGRLSVNEISSYGLGNRIFNIYYAIFRGIALGMIVLQAKNYGSGNRQRSFDLQKLCYYTIIPFAIILAVVIALFANNLLGIMSKDTALLNTSIIFLRVIIIGFPFMSMAALNAAVFQGQGNTKTPMYIALFANVVSIVLGYILIVGVGPFKSLGIMGAAITKICSNIAMCLLGLYLLYGKNGFYFGCINHQIKEIFNLEDIKEILVLGIPAAFEYSFWNVATVYISKVILLYGNNYYASYELGLQVEQLTDMMSTGFVTASTSLSSIAIGKNDHDLYQLYYKQLYKFALTISIIATLFLLTCSRGVLYLLTDKLELIEIAFGYLFTQAFSQLPMNLSRIEYGYIRSTKHEKMPMVISFIGIWLVRLPLVIITGQFLHLNILFIWWAFNMDQWVRYLLSFIYVRKKKVLNYI